MNNIMETKKYKQVNLEQWLKKKKTWFLPEDFQIVNDFMSKQDNETVGKFCDYFSGSLNFFSNKTDSKLYSPKTMLKTAIIGGPPMLTFTMNSKYSVLTHWLWRLLTGIKLISIFLIVGIIWYIFDIVTVKKKTQKYNFDVFCNLSNCHKSENLVEKEKETDKENTHVILSPEIKKQKREENKLLAMKFISLIGLVFCFLLPIYLFCFEFGFEYRDWIFWDEVGAGSMFYIVFYSIAGLFLLWKDNVMKITSLIGLLAAGIFILFAFFTNDLKIFGIILIIFAMFHTIIGLVQSTSKNKIIKSKYLLWGIGGLIILASVFLGVKSLIGFSDESEPDTLLENEGTEMRSVDGSIPVLLSEKESREMSVLLDLPETKTLPDDFKIFLEEFTKDKETQISLMEIPLSIYTLNLESCEEQVEKMMQSKLEKEWYFLENNFFFFGSKKGDNIITCGKFSKKDDVIVYELSNSICPATQLVFNKTKDGWKLHKHINFSVY